MSLLLSVHCAALFAADTPPNQPSSQPSSDSLIEITLGKSEQLSVPGLQRFLVGNPALVAAEQVGSDTLKLTGAAPGRTFVIVWSSQGRRSMPVRVVYPRPTVTFPKEVPIEQRIEHADSLKLGYNVDYEVTGRGPKLSQTDRSTTNVIRHIATHELATPFGLTSSLIGFQRVNAFDELSTWRAALKDGTIGPINRFDLGVGDTGMPFSGGFALPPVALRGGTVDYRQFSPVEAAGFWGQERIGLFGVPSTGSRSQQDSYLYGAQLGYDDPTHPLLMRGSAVFGYGADRPVSRSDHTFDLLTRYKLMEPWTLESDVAVADQDLGYTLASNWQRPGQRVRLKFRDVQKDFESVTGGASYRGERGLALDTGWRLTRTLSLSTRSDVYRTTLFPNPAEPDALNTNNAVDADWRIWPGGDLYGFANRRRTPGLVSPANDLRLGGGGSQRIPLRRILPPLKDLYVSGRYEYIDSRSIPSPALDYTSDVITAGLSMPLFWGFSASASHQWNFTQDTLSGAESEMRRLSTSLMYLTSLRQGQWQVRGRVGYDTEESSGASTRFLTGQDRLVYEAGLEYQPTQSMLYFADARLENVMYNSAQADQVEVSFFTGARLLMDTKVIRWDPSMYVAGVVFHDLNGDGVRQAGEEGLPGVKVVAGMAKKVSTDPLGRFRFGRLWGKAVPISVDVASLPNGYVVSTPRVQIIRPEQGKPQLAFGALGRGEIRGRVFYDVDGDGRFSAADQPLGNVRFRLDSQVVETDGTGWFFVRDLPGGTYTLSIILETLPMPYVPTVPVRQTVELPDGGSISLEMPVNVRRVLEGRVFVDRNGNRKFDQGERLLAGMPICLDGRRTTTTDASGIYRFPDFATGKHRIDLNCGMPLKGLLPLSKTSQRVLVKPTAPPKVTIDFLLDEEGALLEPFLKDQPVATKDEDVTEL